MTKVAPEADGLSVDLAVRAGSMLVEARFTVASGRAVALLGPNGAGKSTIVRALAGLAPLERGRVSLSGAALDDTQARLHSAPQARRIGVVFQDSRLFPWMSALDNVAYGLRAQGSPRRDARATASRWLERLGAGRLAERKAAGLSGGETQRVALARAMAIDPALLLLDEPFASLDIESREETRRALAEAISSARCPRLLVTHDPVDALTLASHIVILEGGRVTQNASMEEICVRPASAYAASVVGLNLFRGVVRSDGSQRTLEGAGFRLHVAEHACRDGSEGLATLAPSAVALSLEPPAGSARNRVRGVVRLIARERGAVRVRIDANPPLVAQITEDALRELGLTEGAEVWASFKAGEVFVHAS